MLKPAWYVIIHPDYPPAAGHARLPQAQAMSDLLRETFEDDPVFDPAHTGAAAEIMVRTAEYLGDAVRHGRVVLPDSVHLDALLHAVNLCLAHLAQATGRLAHQADTNTGADLSGLSDTTRADLTTTLATAAGRLEESAGLFREAHLAARGPRPFSADPA
ncbi:hypothetical protein [Mangrovihabitans endophyticus]|uniref:Uncharacterized protein n=1 Tax=Mangrovihabitans endophyticus TaxID=1751298 RepID=A0A8J3C7N7_9ACTN|nr:hypothetical protein [Mangrovihabitans endophyticus]GGL17389.1 hypothetical protein GCM10012284_59920 [Mangrovihabitans endophyticus]